MNTEKRSFANRAVAFINTYRKEILVGLILLIAILFLVKNADEVEFDLVFFKIDAPLVFLLLLFGGIGAGIVALYWRMSQKDLKYRIRELEAKLKEKESYAHNDVAE